MIRALLACVFFLAFSGICPAEEGKWQTLTDCRLLKKETRDGDSFHVKSLGKEHIFRLYYVDTPEKKEMGLTKRTSEQANYWKIYKKDLYLLAEEASEFTGRLLTRPFTVITRWEDAKGNSALPRHYAVILDADQKDLASLLVENGLARVHGLPVDPPDGGSGKDRIKALQKLEDEARKEKRGAWGLPQKGGKK